MSITWYQRESRVPQAIVNHLNVCKPDVNKKSQQNLRCTYQYRTFRNELFQSRHHEDQ